MNHASCIYVAGGETLAGRALIEHLCCTGYENLVGTPPGEPDLTDAAQVEDFFATLRPEYVFLVAGKSGGILANQRQPAELMRDNLLTATHVLDSAHRHGTTKLLYLASSCIYPRQAPQPLRVESLMTGPLEPTSDAYALAKLTGLQLCQAYRRQYGAAFRTAIAANPFGPHDDFSPEQSHVIPGLIRRLYEARLRGERSVAVWGTGLPRRDFIYARDLADACVFLMQRADSPAPVNIGSGLDLSVAQLAEAVARAVGYTGRLVFDPSRPDGVPVKCLETSALRELGWAPATEFATALAETVDWFLQQAIRPEDAGRACAAV